MTWHVTWGRWDAHSGDPSAAVAQRLGRLRLCRGVAPAKAATPLLHLLHASATPQEAVRRSSSRGHRPESGRHRHSAWSRRGPVQRDWPLRQGRVSIGYPQPRAAGSIPGTEETWLVADCRRGKPRRCHDGEKWRKGRAGRPRHGQLAGRQLGAHRAAGGIRACLLGAIRQSCHR